MPRPKRTLVCPGCLKVRPHYCRGYCSACYNRVKRAEDPEIYRQADKRYRMRMDAGRQAANEARILAWKTANPERVRATNNRHGRKLSRWWVGMPVYYLTPAGAWVPATVVEHPHGCIKVRLLDWSEVRTQASKLRMDAPHAPERERPQVVSLVAPKGFVRP
jgi:hypothetical protein